MPEPQHSIKMAAHRSGLTPHVIRIWEKRYGAVQPCRTETNRRLYCEAEIERLNLLRLVTHRGHNISNVAGLPTETLRALAAEAPALPPVNGTSRALASAAHADQFIQACLVHVRELNAYALDDALGRSALAFGAQGMLQHVTGPLAQKIGDLWRDGTITAAHEHFASARIRAFLTAAARPFPVSDSTPTIVVATPAGQVHELGAGIVAAAASNLGWRVTYLGASLPAAEIAGAAAMARAQAVALSIVYPDDDAGLPPELERLRRYLPSEVKILVGGRAACTYREVLEKLGAIITTSLPDLCSLLEEWRRPVRRG